MTKPSPKKRKAASPEGRAPLPTLSTGVAGADPDGDTLQYLVRVATGSDATTGTVVTSGWQSTPSTPD